jgi:hypothetical protein
MGVKFYKVTLATLSTTGDSDVVNNTCTHAAKERITLSDLPYNYNRNNSHTWCTVYVPTLLCWARAQEDLFGTNIAVKDLVHMMWDRIFPDYMLNDQGLEIVRVVVCLISFYMIITC